jgi:hypothetical protein
VRSRITSHYFLNLAPSPDGRTLLGSAVPANETELWVIGVEAISGRERLRFRHGAPSDRTANVQDQPGALAWSFDGRLIASPNVGDGVNVVDVTTGELLTRLAGHSAAVTAAAFSPDGRWLATASADSTVLLWDVAPVRAKLKPMLAPKPDELPALWAALADSDAAKAYPAMVALRAAGPASIAFLRPKLTPAKIDRDAMARHIASLDAADFNAREKAQDALAKLGDLAEPALRAALNRDLTGEARRRIERVLAGLDGFEHSPERLRELRAVEVIEAVGGAEAKRVLSELAKGDADARLTRDARASLERLGRH